MVWRCTPCPMHPRYSKSSGSYSPWWLGATQFGQQKNVLKKSKEEKKMILVNTDYIAGKELEMLGLVKGSTIQSVNMGKDIGQAFKSLVGGELKSYNEMMNNARALATKRMVEEAEALGAPIQTLVNKSLPIASVPHQNSLFGDKFLLAVTTVS